MRMCEFPRIGIFPELELSQNWIPITDNPLYSHLSKLYKVRRINLYKYLAISQTTILLQLRALEFCVFLHAEIRTKYD